jgi:hypothetical protein
MMYAIVKNVVAPPIISVFIVDPRSSILKKLLTLIGGYAVQPACLAFSQRAALEQVVTVSPLNFCKNRIIERSLGLKSSR